jgi:hypothetical protein
MSQKGTDRLLEVELETRAPSTQPNQIFIGYIAFRYVPGQCFYVLLPGGSIKSPIIYVFDPTLRVPFSSAQPATIYYRSTKTEKTETIVFQTFINHYLHGSNDQEFLVQPGQEKKMTKDFLAMVKPHNGGNHYKYRRICNLRKTFPDSGDMLIVSENGVNYLAVNRMGLKLETKEVAIAAAAEKKNN